MDATEQVTPEKTALRDGLIKYEMAAAGERAHRDALVATWRDILHQTLQQVGPIDPIPIHQVIDNMDDFLNRAGGRRK